jgi:glutamate--cysteine ligase
MDFTTQGYEDLELSTQMIIKEALNRGAEVDVLDRKANFIAISLGGKTEYLKEATKTSLDTYVTFHLMENKEVTKKVLARQKISVPRGAIFYNPTDALNAYEEFKHQDLVIKPTTTNFGTGVVILKRQGTLIDRTAYNQAVERAFSFDASVIVEEFLEGKEYRFLVIGNEVIAVLHRVPANVEGDDIHTVEELVFLKNQNPLRGSGYKTPLEKIKLGTPELEYLAGQGKTAQYRPAQGEIVYLRKNSNISTGGDSIDYTDSAHKFYKTIAVKAARAVQARICGADIIISDITREPGEGEYGIIELNFNPALHIHGFPHQGKNRHPEKKVLDLLGF